MDWDMVIGGVPLAVCFALLVWDRWRAWKRYRRLFVG